MISIIDAMRDVIGTANFYLASGDIDYGAAFEYFVAALILVIVISSVFRIFVKIFK